MSKLVNDSVTSLFTISTSEWTSINQRVGVVLAAEAIASIISSDLPSYPALLTSSKLWESNTFNGLISESSVISTYADNSITNFMSISDSIKKVTGNDVPVALQTQLKNALKQLVTDTTPIVNTSTVLSTELGVFLKDNQLIDNEIALNKDALGSFWAPIGASIEALESAAGTVTGSWRAILDDLNSTVTKDIDVTMPFIESLEIDAAIISWQSIKTEATAFSSKVAGQENYWHIS
jgi:hypothetical protein